jgi:hypothetical protein
MIPLFPLFFAFHAHATTPPGLNLAAFQSLTMAAAIKGEVLQGNDYDFHVLMRVTPTNPNKTHHAEYFSAAGVTDTNGKFSAFQVSVVSEHWVKKMNGNWDIDQWIWNAALDGEMQLVNHFRLQETAEGSVVGDDALPLGSPVEQAARWVKKVAEWVK